MKLLLIFLFITGISEFLLAADASYESFRFFKNGKTHHGKVYLPKDFNCQQEQYWVLFNWHGWAQSPDNQNERIDARSFADENRGIIVAASDELCPEQDSWVSCTTEEMKEVVDWAYEKYSCIDQNKTVFGSYSAGGQAAYRYMSTYPHEVIGMIALSANGHFAGETQKQKVDIVHIHGSSDRAPYYARCGNYPCYDGPSPVGGRRWVLEGLGQSLNCNEDEMITSRVTVAGVNYTSERWERGSCDYGSTLRVLSANGKGHNLTVPDKITNHALKHILNMN